MSKQHYLLEWFGRTPEHYTLYPLPDDRQAGKDYFRIGMTLDRGEVLIFEYDFPVPHYLDLPWEDLENSKAASEFYKQLHEKHYGKLVYPCDRCTRAGAYDCKRCPRWRQWYCSRQSQINAFAERIEKYWRYELPLHRITGKG